MLQRKDMFNIVRKSEEVDSYLWDIYKESKIFISSSNFIETNKDILLNINQIKIVSESIRSIINLIFVKMNPGINSLIALDNQKSKDNYSNLSLKIEKLLESIENKTSEFFSGILTRIDIETNVIANQSKIDSFMAIVNSVYKDLVLRSLKTSVDDYLQMEKPAIKEIEGGQTILKITDKNKEAFWYLVYQNFSNLAQITVSLVKFTQASIQVRPSPIVDAAQMYAKNVFAGKKNDESDSDKEPEEPSEGDSGENEEDEEETEELVEVED